MFGWFSKPVEPTTTDDTAYESYFDQLKKESPIRYSLLSREEIGGNKHHYQLPDGASALVDHASGRISIDCKRPDGSHSKFASSRELRDEAVKELRDKHRFLSGMPRIRGY